MNETIWAIRYKEGFWGLELALTRTEVIQKYLEKFKYGSVKNRSWRWHVENCGVKAVKIKIQEVEK